MDAAATVSVFVPIQRFRDHIWPKVTLPWCRLGFSVLVYGLGSKKNLLEDFRLSQLSQEIHLVINGFFPSITLKSVSIQRFGFVWGGKGCFCQIASAADLKRADL